MSAVTRAETYTVPTTTRYSVPAGTRCAFAERPARVGGTSLTRLQATDQVIRAAVDAWEAQWGPVPWDLASLLVTHTTIQVVVELRVEP